MSKVDRGDRYWCKQNAAATLVLLNKITSLMNYNGKDKPTDKDEEFDLGKRVAEAEREAAAAIDRAMKGRK